MSTPTMRELVRVFGRIGWLSFGGPAAQIALMHRELVETREWLTEEGYLRALSLCMLLPGPEAMQLAIYAGWRLRGHWGGVIAGLLFVIPGAVVILCLALGYAVYGQIPLVQAAFEGIKAAVIIIVLQALLKVSRKALIQTSAVVLAGLAFVALFFIGLPFPLIIVAAAVFGILDRNAPEPPKQIIQLPPPKTGQTLVIWVALWGAPVLMLWLTNQAFLMQVALFFSKLAVVTFGGAYAVLAYMTQTVVQDFGWMTTAGMIDALGLAETTPGPLILVTEFVALLAGFAQGGIGTALAAGAVTLWVTFTPCFLWIFLAGPYLDKIATRPRLSAALGAITAAVVGVILNLAIWFGIHVLFTRVGSAAWHAAPVPDLSSLDHNALVLTTVAAVLLLWLKRGMVQTLAVMAAVGLSLTAV